jgi:hypothetical protein
MEGLCSGGRTNKRALRGTSAGIKSARGTTIQMQLLHFKQRSSTVFVVRDSNESRGFVNSKVLFFDNGP